MPRRVADGHDADRLGSPPSPKCPVCWASYLSVFGIAGIEQIPYASCMVPRARHDDVAQPCEPVVAQPIDGAHVGLLSGGPWRACHRRDENKPGSGSFADVGSWGSRWQDRLSARGAARTTSDRALGPMLPPRRESTLGSRASQLKEDVLGRISCGANAGPTIPRHFSRRSEQCLRTSPPSPVRKP